MLVHSGALLEQCQNMLGAEQDSASQVSKCQTTQLQLKCVVAGKCCTYTCSLQV